MRLLRLMLALLALGAALVSTPQTAPSRDSTADTVRAARLGDLEVTVTRRREALSRLPAAVGVIGAEALGTAQPTLGLDEALSTVPGVHVANRWNFSLDQRLSIRGFGSRANFGVRGLKVLLDGVPQTLPDGQSQLTNVEYAILDRVEVLRGAASALYGNASGGVLSFFTQPLPARPGGRGNARYEAGSFDTEKWAARVAGRAGRTAGALWVSRLESDGFRAHSATAQRQVGTTLAWDASSRTTLTARWAFNDTPQAQNPGALTPAEADADPRAAAPANLARGADKRVSQHQASIRVEHHTAGEWQLEATAFAFWRDLENPLATPPPGPASPTAGTYNTIDRAAGGVRAQAVVPLGGAGADRLDLTTGVDLQRMDDARVNRRSEGGEPTTVILADQQELTTEIGPFAQLRWPASRRVVLHGGVRYDRVSFEVRDRHLADGIDNSGRRTMAELSGNFGATVELGQWVRTWAAVATAFETPTSTELVTTATGGVGFNPDLGPQRATTVEVGGRASGGWWSLSAALFANRIRDGIVQARERDGRAFFANAARMRNDGVELGLSLIPSSLASLNLAYTYARFRFGQYRLQNGATVDTLDGKRVAGVPRHFLRAGLRLEPRAGLTVFLDQLASSSLFADDRNTLEVADWGAGVTNLRVAWAVPFGRARLTPFAAIQNLFARRFVGAVTINGFGGRVLEPAPGRHVFLGMEAGWH